MLMTAALHPHAYDLMCYCPTPTPFLVKEHEKTYKVHDHMTYPQSSFNEKQCISHANMIYYTQKKQKHEHMFDQNDFRNPDNGRDHRISKNLSISISI